MVRTRWKGDDEGERLWILESKFRISNLRFGVEVFFFFFILDIPLPSKVDGHVKVLVWSCTGWILCTGSQPTIIFKAQGRV